MKTIACLLSAALLVACNGNTGTTSRRHQIRHNNDSLHRYADDVKLLQQQTTLAVLKDSTAQGSIAIAPEWQGRVLLSTSNIDTGLTTGWINRNTREGGEDIWADSSGTAFVVKQHDKQSVLLEKINTRTRMSRKISLIARRDMMNYLGTSINRHVKGVAFESENVLVNTDTVAAQLAVKITGYFPGNGENIRLLLPDKPNYRFNIVQPGKSVTLSATTACNYFGYFDAEQNLLTIIQFTMPEGKTAYAEDAVITINGDNNIQLSASSPLTKLKPGGSLQHYHRTLHLSGTDKQLEPVLKSVFGITMKQLDATF